MFDTTGKISTQKVLAYIAVALATLDSRFHTETKTGQYASLLHKSPLPSAICYINDPHHFLVKIKRIQEYS